MHLESIHSASLCPYFVMLQPYSKMDAIHFFLIILHNGNMKFLHQLQPQVFLSMMLQAWHTYFWAVFPILLCRTSQAPSGQMGSAQPFSDFSREGHSDSNLGSGWATQGHSQSYPIAAPLLSWLCA